MDVEAMKDSHVKLYFQDRLRIINEIDERGSIEQKKNCLARVLTHPQHGILPKFYSVRVKSGVRYPGDGGPDPQIETDYESTEEDLEEISKKAQEPERYKRGRHKERRRRSARQARAKRRLRLALSYDPRISTYTTETFMDLNALGLALRRQWPMSPSFEVVIEQLQKVRDGSESEASFLTLDTEFIASTRRVLEVAVGEFNSGKVLLDSRVDNQCSTEELLKGSQGRVLESYERKQSFRNIRKVYGSSDPAKCSDKKTAREIAEILKNAGVTKQSIFLVWHTNRFDFTLLKELLESAGCDDILPPAENCIPMISHFRQGLPPKDRSGKMFTCRLDQLFPALFAGHELIGLSHNAAPDIQMLRLVVLLLIQLQRPLSKRNLDDFPKTTQEFVKDARPPHNFLDRWLGFSSTHHTELEDDDHGKKISEEDCDDEDCDDEDCDSEDF